ncbi:LytR C-terminal domain-containing protein [Patescibacteria group bacterium]
MSKTNNFICCAINGLLLKLLVFIAKMEYNSLEESAELTSSSVTRLMAFPIDRYLIYENDIDAPIEKLFQGELLLDYNIEYYSNLKNSLKTDLTLNEFINIYSFTRTLPKDRLVEKVLSSTYIEKPNLLDEELMDLTFDSQLSRERMNIAILNGTSISGVASYGSRVIKNMGGRVVAVGNTNNDYEDTVLITNSPTAESTKLLKKIFKIENVLLDSEAHNFRESEIDRADITIIFGLDFAKSL